jgi:hypothetical protein
MATAVVGLVRRAPPQHGADARQQLLRGEGLGDVVVGARVEAVHLVGLVATRGQHQDRDRLGARVGAPAAGQRDAGLARQHPVQQDGVRQHRVDLALGRLAVFRPHRRQAVVAQVDGDQFGDGGFVFDDQDARLVFHALT